MNIIKNCWRHHKRIVNFAEFDSLLKDFLVKSMVEKSENSAMDDNENYLEVRKSASLSWCRKVCGCCSCLLNEWFPIKLPWVTRLRGKKHQNHEKSFNLYHFDLPVTAFKDELLALHHVVRQCQRESIREIHAEPGDTESGKRRIWLEAPTHWHRKTRFNCKLLL